MALSVPEEQTLVTRAKSGDPGAFENLVRENAERLYAAVLRCCTSDAEAREATEQAFLRASQDLGAMPGDGRLLPWLYPIAMKEAKRLRSRASEVADRDAGQPAAAGDASELCDALERAIRALPEKCRAAVVLHDVEGISTTDAAEILGMRETQFRKRLSRGRMALRRRLADQLAVTSGRSR